ncbi:iron complex transport system ATP-binding protein [Salana multivorans]|uniref:Iron complex transport system ATP-binding protein n=2 Tax=Salana multivorans TaxID=120377 RepID=A0A3N2D7B8_9MICO|nr:ABC transporter ATP-binding protein [Salana multivorans]ROR95558.1 iron complex transport system ATP-binding protein [Salana multivorans]
MTDARMGPTTSVPPGTPTAAGTAWHGAASRLRAERLRVGYGQSDDILHDVDVAVPEGELTVIVGPNACGKSTLLKALARMLAARQGQVLLDGQPIGTLAPKAVARRLGLLPQGPTAPDGITVSDLVARGRYPHQNLLRQWSARDEQAVVEALLAANVADLADRNVDELSGGQRQRVWIAMALAQETQLLLLDEPTTYLDIAHQVEVLSLTRRLHRSGRTVVLVLHELHLAFRYATHLIVMREGRIVAEGRPEEIVTADLIERVYDLPCRVVPDPVTGRPLVLPLDQDAAWVAGRP